MLISTLRTLLPVALALVFLAGGCGNDDNGSPSAAAETVASASPADEYRDQVTAIVRRSDEARGNFRGASSTPDLVKAAHQLALTSRAAASDVEKLDPPPSYAPLGAKLAEKYRLWAAKLEAEAGRKPVSTERLADVVRNYGKLVDFAYDYILVAP